MAESTDINGFGLGWRKYYLETRAPGTQRNSGDAECERTLTPRYDKRTSGN